jgi:mycothiol synthase
MNRISSRIFEGEKDFQIMIDLIARVRPLKYLYDYPSQVDMEENFASPSIRASTCLWFEDGQLIGWAFVDDFRNLWWELENNYDAFVGKQIVEWGMDCVRRTVSNNEKATLDTSCREDNEDRLSFLHKHGFKQEGATTIYMARSLSEPIPEPGLPLGFVIRFVTGHQEAEVIARTHRAAFGTEYMTTERRLAIMNTSEYDPSLDLVVIAPDGTIAAYCTCSVNGQKLTGNTDPVATHPHYQRMGLARALLLQGLQLLKGRGMKSAHLGTSGDNMAMEKTAESVGFKVEHNTLWFSKEIR